MNTFQKVIKYFAIALAFLIIGSIISIAFEVVSSFTDVFNKEELTDKITYDVKSNIEKLDIKVNSTKLSINKGDSFKVTTNSNKIKVNETNGKLEIIDKSNKMIKDKEVIITIPSNYNFTEIKIDLGAGETIIDTLSALIVDIEMGAGKLTINDIEAINSMDLDGGAGEIKILNGKINNLDLDMGVGKTTVNGLITGKSKIDAGVGGLYIDLLSTLEDYKIKVSKGIGSVKLNDSSLGDNTITGNGINLIDIEGGIGEINITTK